jgi:tetratricopeptide (TPR) repeat protein
VQLDPNLADAHLGMGNLLLFNFQWDDARAEYKRAIEIEPLNASAHQWAGDVMYTIGKPHESLDDLRRATELDPSSPVIHTDYGFALLISGKYPEARVELEKSMELDSALSVNETNMLNLYYATGKYDSVIIADHRKGRGVSKVFHLAALKKLGETAAAAKLADSIRTSTALPHSDGDGTVRSMLYAITGQPDSAFIYLNRMIDVKSGFLLTGGISCWSLYESLHNDPRWDQILKRNKVGRCQH